jgi:hypothetical protein
MAKTKKTVASKAQIVRDAQRVALKAEGMLTRDFLRQHSLYSDKMRAKYFPTFESLLTEADLIEQVTKATPEEKLAIKQAEIAAKKDDGKKVLEAAVKKIEALEEENEVLLNLRDRTPQLFDIAPKVSKGKSESVAFIVMSDWHSEELVLPGQVGGLNEHNLTIGEARATKAWQGGQRLWDIFRKDTAIKTIVVALLGDFITGRIHEDTSESCLLPPSDSIYRAQNMILSGLQFLLANTESDVEIIVVCHSGNHGRMTKDQLIANERGNSLEQYMYFNIRDHFKGDARIKFQIADGYHSYVTLWDRYVVRLHHGHQINYGGGVGGITIPVNKAIAQWNKGRKADLDVFGHFHQNVNFSNFVCNGSLIGYNAYALSIKADYEPPTQSFFLINKKYNRKTIHTPIFV